MDRVMVRWQADASRGGELPEEAWGLYRPLPDFARGLPPSIKSGIERQPDPIKCDTSPDPEQECSEAAEAPAVASAPTAALQPRRLLEHLTDGSISIESVEAFRCLLDDSPEHPDLLRMYAGRLTTDNLSMEAAGAYDRAAGLFFRAGRLFQGWVCTILKWRLQKPDRDQIAAVQLAIESAGSPRNPADDFVKALTLAERVAVFSHSRLIGLPPDALVVSAGDRRGDLYFVVSGVLRSSVPNAATSKPLLLRETDLFGFTASGVGPTALYPEVQSATRVELVTIPREHLLGIFQRMPSAGRKFQELCRRLEIRQPANFERKRKGERYFIRTLMNVSIPQLQVGRPSLVLKGFSHEFSLTGVSFIPEQNGTPQPLGVLRNAGDLVGRNVRARILAEGVAVEVRGRIVRTNQLALNGRKLLCFAIQFAELTPQVRGMIFTFAENARVHLPVSEHKYLFSCPLDHHWRI